MNGKKQNSKGKTPVFSKVGRKLHRDVLKGIIIGLACLVVAGLIFGAGVFIGGMKARFSYRWAESYHRNFAGPRGGFMGDWQRGPLLPGDFIESHGAFGEIIELKDNGFVIKGRGDVEKVVIISKDTVVKKGMETLKDDLKVGDNVVIVGSPNEEGQIEAKLIRLFEGKPRDLPMLDRGFQFPLF